MAVDLRLGDCLEILPTLEAGSVDEITENIDFWDVLALIVFLCVIAEVILAVPLLLMKPLVP